MWTSIITLVFATILFSAFFGRDGRTVTIGEDDEAPCSAPVTGLNEEAPPKRSCEPAPVPRVEVPPARPTLPRLERVDVWKFEDREEFGKSYTIRKLILTARLTHHHVLLSAGGDVRLALELAAETGVDRTYDPIGFMHALLRTYPNTGLDVACGAPFAEVYHKEAA